MMVSSLEQIFSRLPEVQAGIGCIQNEFHEFDVYDHTIAVVTAVKDFTSDAETIVAAYLHDIGKPVVAEPRLYDGVLQYDGLGRPRQTFPDHESKGARMVRSLDSSIFHQHGLDQENIARLVEHHFTPMKGIKQMRLAKDYASFISAYDVMKETLAGSGTDMVELMSLFAADIIGKGNGAEDAGELLKIRSALLGESTLPGVYHMQKDLGGTDRRYAVKE